MERHNKDWYWLGIFRLEIGITIIMIPFPIPSLSVILEVGFIYIYTSSSYIIYIYYNNLSFIVNFILQICIFPHAILIWMIR